VGGSASTLLETESPPFTWRGYNFPLGRGYQPPLPLWEGVGGGGRGRGIGIKCKTPLHPHPPLSLQGRGLRVRLQWGQCPLPIRGCSLYLKQEISYPIRLGALPPWGGGTPPDMV